MTYETAPNYGHQPSRGGSGLAVTSLVLGILGLITFWTVIGGILLGLAAVIVGFIALARIKRGRGGGRVMAIIGIVTGALGLLVAVGLVALGASILNSESGKNLQECLQGAGADEAAQAECQEEFAEELGS